MPLDFTLETYNLLLDALEGYEVFTVKRFLEEQPSSSFVILRHDVDRFPKNALRMAKLESSRGFYSTYYFRVGRRIDKNVIREIAQMGHETGYHYEVLSKTNGDYDRALKLFEAELKRLRSICDVKTISMHGKPLSKWDNSLLWTRHSFEQYDIIGDGKLSISNVPYFTDSGRNWDGSNNIRDHPSSEQENVKIENTFQLINLINSRHYGSYYLNIHPERWAQYRFELIFSYFIDRCFNIGKKTIHSLMKLLTFQEVLF